MARQFPRLQESHIRFVQQQKIFFVATAAANGRVNLSPKGYDSLHIVDAGRILWLNLTGSGNESAAHVLANNRMTLMFCSFDEQPLILRIYGEARVIHFQEPDWAALAAHFSDFPGARQIFDVTIQSVQTSCGFAVPHFQFTGERTRLLESSENRGPTGAADYWRAKNMVSIDGFPTGMVIDDDTE